MNPIFQCQVGKGLGATCHPAVEHPILVAVVFVVLLVGLLVLLRFVSRK